MRLLRTAHYLLPVVLCAVIVGPLFAQGEQGALLRLKYEAGETLTYHVTINGLGSMQAAGQQQPLSIEGTFDNLMQVEQVSPEGNFTVSSTYENLDLTVKMSGQDMDVPINLPDIRFVIMPTGKILSMELLEAEQPAQGAASLQAMVASSLDLESLLKDIKCVPFPEAAVKPGEEWEGAVPLAAAAEGEEPRQMKMKLKYVGDERPARPSPGSTLSWAASSATKAPRRWRSTWAYRLRSLAASSRSRSSSRWSWTRRPSWTWVRTNRAYSPTLMRPWPV